MLNGWITNVLVVISTDLSCQVTSDPVVHYLHELLFLDGKPSDNFMRLVEKFGNLVMETSKVANNGVFFLEIFSPERVVEKTVSNN